MKKGVAAVWATRRVVHAFKAGGKAFPPCSRGARQATDGHHGILPAAALAAKGSEISDLLLPSPTHACSSTSPATQRPPCLSGRDPAPRKLGGFRLHTSRHILSADRKQLGDIHLKRFSDVVQHRESGIRAAGLQPTDVGSVHAYAVGELLLSDVLGSSELLNAQSKPCPRVRYPAAGTCRSFCLGRTRC